MTATLHENQYTFYLALLFSEWEMFHMKVVAKTKAHFMFVQ